MHYIIMGFEFTLGIMLALLALWIVARLIVAIFDHLEVAKSIATLVLFIGIILAIGVGINAARESLNPASGRTAYTNPLAR